VLRLLGIIQAGRYVSPWAQAQVMTYNKITPSSWGNNGGLKVAADGLFADIDLNSPFANPYQKEHEFASSTYFGCNDNWARVQVF
jgi:hypothetical protein